MRLTIDHCINECGDERAMSSAFHEQHRGHVARPFHQNHNEKLLTTARKKPNHEPVEAGVERLGALVGVAQKVEDTDQLHDCSIDTLKNEELRICFTFYEMGPITMCMRVINERPTFLVYNGKPSKGFMTSRILETHVAGHRNRDHKQTIQR
ncbi:hypothetical protein B566_EDAN017885 [Ephemera danica]|nr:hypothetical protein B566_EDAN017885 [Ephemera danica]